MRGFKNARYYGLVGAVADHLDRGFAAHQQSQCIDEDGFARAGFAGEQVEPRAERGDGVIDDGVVFSAQFDEHGVVHSEKAGPSTPLSPHRLRPVDGDPVRSAQDDSILL